ncbi:hypothetical protein FDP41_013107 [Naegleria fowleri]|uniref:F-box domain-containing protein n=1 Tax=Naegleria fowleri TaxID=5763 RepID=A0A6A5C255_NAEFO|nr:uncharacterized protein FDP41_013107 [Naegleria fowleri]KAF0980624.1 hypothetical protein FDP41_013107 [Naegleria fowleri]
MFKKWSTFFNEMLSNRIMNRSTRTMNHYSPRHQQQGSSTHHDPSNLFIHQNDLLNSNSHSASEFADDMIFQIYQFLDWKFIFSVCARVSKRWYLKSLEIPYALDLSDHFKEGRSISATKKKFYFDSTELLTHFSKCRNVIRLTELNLKGCRVAYEGAVSIASSPFMRNLTFLNLQNNELGNEGIRLIVNSENSKKLKGLVLNENHFGYSGVLAIASSENLKLLQTLHLGQNNIESIGLTALCDSNSSVLKNLTSLDLSYNSVGSESDIQCLSQCQIFSNLKDLNLSGNRIHFNQVKFIASSPILKNLMSLDMSDNFVVPEGAQFISEGSFQNLQTLKLKRNNIQDEGVKYISESDKMKYLTWLDLGDNGIENTGISYLANNNTSQLKHLTALFLEKNYILTQGVSAIANSVHLSQHVRILNLAENFILQEGIKLLCERMKNLTWLNVKGCMIGNDGIEMLSQSENMKQLTFLDVSFNELGTPCAISLANSPILSHLKELLLSHNHVGFYGANAIATSPYLNLRRLEISGNCIGVEGEKLIRENLVNLEGFFVQERRSFDDDIDMLDELVDSSESESSFE